MVDTSEVPEPRSGQDGVASRGVQVAILAYLIWGLLTIYWKQLSAFGAAELIGWRMLTAAVVMAALTTFRGRWPVLRAALTTRSTLLRLLAAAVLLTLNWGSYIWAVLNDRVVETALGYFIAPLATMGMGVLILDEHPNRAQRLAFVCAATAVVVLTFSYGRPPWIALVIAASWSLYGLNKRYVPLGPIDSLAGEIFVLLTPALAIVAVSSSRIGSVVDSANGVEWAFVMGTGLITAIPLILFASAAQSIPFTLLGPLNLLVPVINFGLGWLLYGEPMPLGRFIGFGFVWVALVAVMADRVQHARRVMPTIAPVT